MPLNAHPPRAKRGRFAAAAASLLTGTLIALTAGAVPAHAAVRYESEPNNSTATANALPLGDTIVGTASGDWSDEDYYRIDVPSTGRLTLRLTFPANLGTNAGYDVGILDANGQDEQYFEVAANEWNGDPLASNAIFLAPGRHYIKVKAWESHATWGKQYRLTASHVPGYAEFHPNGDTATANPLVLGKSIAGSMLDYGYADEDYYRFDIPSTGRTQVRLTFPANLGTDTAYDVTIYDAAGTREVDEEVDANENNGNVLASKAMYLAPGRHYLKLYGTEYRKTWGKEYKLTVSHTPQYAEAEDNGSTATATPLALGKTIAGSSFGSSDYDDYFRVDMPASGRVALKLTYPSSLGAADTQYYVKVLDAAGDTINSFEQTGSEWNGAWLAKQVVILPKGRSYIRISGSYSDQVDGKQYALSVTPWLSAAPTPSISGTRKVGSTLSAKAGTWKPAGVKLSYQWKRNGAAIKGAVKATYKVATADAGRKLTVTVTGKKSGYVATAKTSSAASIPLLKLSAAPTPRIAGTVKVGKTLTATAGSWKPAPVKLSYQWKRNGVSIKGATKSTYKVSKADRSKTISVWVKGSKAYYAPITKKSAGKRVPR